MQQTVPLSDKRGCSQLQALQYLLYANLAPSKAGREVLSALQAGGHAGETATGAGFARSPSSPSLSTLSGHQYEHFTFPSSALTSSSLKNHRGNGSIKSRTLRGRQRSLSDTSDTTVVPATFARDTRLSKESASNFPPSIPAHTVKVATTASPPTSGSSTSQESIRAASRTSSKPQYIGGTESQSLSPRALQTLLVTLQLLSLVPALVGGSYCIYRAFLPQARPTPFKQGLVKTLEWNRRIEWLLCAMWAALSGNYCHSMARGLTRRWLVYYPLPAAVIRLVICWPLTKFTVVNFFGKEELQLPAWIVCAVTAAISNTVQIWYAYVHFTGTDTPASDWAFIRVTSNLRFLLVSGASSHPASWASRLPATQRRDPTPPSSASAAFTRGIVDHAVNALPPDFTLPRGLRSKQVIKQTVLPIATCSFCTLLWALVEVYSMRGSKLHILSEVSGFGV